MTRPAKVFAVVPAAGIGRRMGADCPKQYLTIGGRPLLHYSVQALLRQPDIHRIVVVLHPSDPRAGELELLADPRIERATGGAERADSVLAGLRALAPWAGADDWVLVHDAARPCLPREDMQRLLDTVLAREEGAILAQPVVDTLKQADADGRVLATVDRRRFWRAQTPQMFRLGELREALESALAAGIAVTDEAAAMERAELPVHLVEGSGVNIKVTVPADLALAAFYLSRAGEGGSTA